MAKRSAALAVAAALAVVLAGCATSTPYQPNLPGQKASGGYSEVLVEQNRWRVTFAGNSLTSRQTVEAYLLFRAAELTVQQSYDWFHIVDRNTQVDAYTYVDPDPFYSPWYGPGYAYWRPSWRYWGAGGGWNTWDPYWGGPFWGNSFDIRTVEKFEATAEIFMGKGPKNPNDPRAFDARQVIANLQPRIVYPEAKKGTAAGAPAAAPAAGGEAPHPATPPS